MRTEKIVCDCCHKETQSDECMRLKLPIIKQENYRKVLIEHDMDLCLECVNKISRAYYEIANNNGYSGIVVIRTDEEGAG